MGPATDGIQRLKSLIEDPQFREALISLAEFFGKVASALVTVADYAAKAAIGLGSAATSAGEWIGAFASRPMDPSGYLEEVKASEDMIAKARAEYNAAIEQGEKQRAVEGRKAQEEVIRKAAIAEQAKTAQELAAKRAEQIAKEEEQMRDSLARQVEGLRFKLASDLEQEEIMHAERLKMLQEALDMRVVTQAEYDELEVQAAADKAARIAEIEQRAADDRSKQEEAVQNMIKSIRQDAINNAINLMGVLGRKNKAFAIAQVALSKAQAMAEAIHKTHLAAAAALVTDPTGVSSARVTAIGYANVAAIAATGLAEIANLSAGGNTGAAGGSTSTITNPNAEGSQQQVATRKANVYIDMRGDDDAMLSRNRVRKLLEQINEAMGDGSMLVVAA
jgi:hypothetical protein